MIKKGIGTKARGIQSRALTIARTEIIRAHAEGQLDTFEKLKVEKLGVMAEWSTAGDDRVCGLCSDLEGVVITVREARGIIPRHPNCRCTYVPANVGESQKGQIRGKEDVQKAFDKSIRSEMPKIKKRTFAEQKVRSKWAGADRSIAKARPKSILEPKAVPKPPTAKAVPKPKPKPKPTPKPTPKPAPKIVPSTSQLADPKVQAMISDYETYSRTTKIPKLVQEKALKRLRGKLALRGIKLREGKWVDVTKGIKAPSPEKLTKVRTKPIRTDKAKAQRAWEKSVTKEEREGIEYWSTDVYGVIGTRDVHAGRKVATEVEKLVKSFDRVTARAPRYEGVAYRGQSLPNVKDVKIGDSFEFGHAVSASKNLDVGEEFLGYAVGDPVLLEIHSKSGVDISKLVIEDYRDQAEVFLKAGKFKVRAKKLIKRKLTDEDQYYHIVLEEL